MKQAKEYFSSANVSMSKMKYHFSTPLVVCIFVFAAFVGISAQDFEAKITLNPTSTKIYVEGRILKRDILQSPKNFAFARSIASAENLGERVSALNLNDEQNQRIAVKELIAGEYLAEKEGTSWDYQIDVKSPENFTKKAHISWLRDERGILMLGDLLPQFTSSGEKPISARIKFELPTDWKISSGEKRIGENTFEVRDFQKAVFVIGRDWRVNEVKIGNFAAEIAAFGEWRFSDNEAAEMTENILESYKKFFGAFPVEKIQIILVPIENNFGRWEAETRGATLTIISGDMAFKKPSIQRLHEQLRHELFHLWIPNNLALKGNYDWFYEGFTVYQSLRTGVALNRLSFGDFLDTLMQAYNLANVQDQQISLVEASKMRKSGMNPQIYARGMLSAFLCDAAILQKSRGKRDISEIFREVYQSHRLPNEPQEGNIAILKVLRAHPELIPVIENYIVGIKKIDWTEYLEDLGIEEIKENSVARLKVKDKLSSRQKDLLDKLGYNNWRKIAEKSK